MKTPKNYSTLLLSLAANVGLVVTGSASSYTTVPVSDQATLTANICNGCALNHISYPLPWNFFGGGSLISDVYSFQTASLTLYLYEYQIDASNLPDQPDSCLSLALLQTGAPITWSLSGPDSHSQCFWLSSTGPNALGASQIGSDIEFDFNRLVGSGCGLATGSRSFIFGFISAQPPVTNSARITERSFGGGTLRVATVAAWSPGPCKILPVNICGNSVGPPQVWQTGIPKIQGRLDDTNGPVNGTFDMRFQLYDSQADPVLQTNGTAVSEVITQRVEVANGLFDAILPYGPNSFFGHDPIYLDIGVRPTNINNFTHLGQRLPITPSPLAYHAAVADGVLSLASGQAVTSINQLQDDVTLVAGSNITITNGRDNNTLVISATGGGTNYNGGGVWSLTGNAGTSPATNFIGTTDNQSLQLRASNIRAIEVGPNRISAGARAMAVNPGTFVFADSADVNFSSTADDQFLVRANGGVGLGTPNTPDFGLSLGFNTHLNDQVIYLRGGTDHNHGLAYCGLGVNNFTASVQPDGPVLWGYSGGALGVLNGGARAVLTWTNGGVSVNGGFSYSSDRNLKSGFSALDPRDILARVASMPVTSWAYTNDISIRHVGPTAQDFCAAFQLGNDGQHINIGDESGVALAAIQGLDAIMKEKDMRILALEENVTELRALVEKLARDTNGGSK